MEAGRRVVGAWSARSFRTKLLSLFVVGVTWAVTVLVRRAFERQDWNRSTALVAQFRREFARRGQEVIERVEGIAGAESTIRLAVSLRGPSPDYSPYVNEAGSLANSHQLDFLE